MSKSRSYQIGHTPIGLESRRSFKLRSGRELLLVWINTKSNAAAESTKGPCVRQKIKVALPVRWDARPRPSFDKRLAAPVRRSGLHSISEKRRRWARLRKDQPLGQPRGLLSYLEPCDSMFFRHCSQPRVEFDCGFLLCHQDRWLIPVRVGKCDLTGTLRSIIYIDLIGLGEEDAERPCSIPLIRLKRKSRFRPDCWRVPTPDTPRSD